MQEKNLACSEVDYVNFITVDAALLFASSVHAIFDYDLNLSRAFKRYLLVLQ